MLIELAERLEATIHRINGHWWNRRKRPDARDIRAAIDLIRARAGASHEGR
jgi:hypothetical protein